MEPIVAPVIGVKHFTLTRDGYLCSPMVGRIWPPGSRNYKADRGLFFWAFPDQWLSRIRPYEVSPDSVVAIIRVIPRRSRAILIKPVGRMVWPEYAPCIPPGADCVVARNFVGLAYAIEIVRVWVNRPIQARWLRSIYNLPATVAGKRRPIRVDAYGWLCTGTRYSVTGTYSSAHVYRNIDAECLMDWNDGSTRARVVRAVQTLLRE